MCAFLLPVSVSQSFRLLVRLSSSSFSLPLMLSLISRFSPFLHSRSSNMDAENVIEFPRIVCAEVRCLSTFAGRVTVSRGPQKKTVIKKR